MTDKDPMLTRLFAEDEGLAPPPRLAERVRTQVGRERRRQRLASAALAGVVTLAVAGALPFLLQTTGGIAGPMTLPQFLSPASPAVMALGATIALVFGLRGRRRRAAR